MIATYNESLSWLPSTLERLESMQFCANVFVYVKLDSTRNHCARMPRCTLERLPNVGREAHTYLHHMRIRTNASDYTLFFQGTPHADLDKYMPIDIFSERCIKQASRFGCSTNVMRSRLLKPLSRGTYRFSMQHHFGPEASLSLGEFVIRHVRPFLPMRFPRGVEMPFHVGANFAVHRQLQLPVALVNELLYMSAQESHPEVAHLLERLWFMMFRVVRECRRTHTSWEHDEYWQPRCQR